MSWWQIVLLALAGVIGVALIVVAGYVGFWLLMVGGKWCRCGHADTAHRGPGTECRGWRQRGENALGIAQTRSCDCNSFRRTERGRWQRLWVGFEEGPS